MYIVICMNSIEYHPKDSIAEYNNIDAFQETFNHLWDEIFDTKQFIVILDNYGIDDKNTKIHRTYTEGTELLRDITEHANQWSIKVKLTNNHLKLRFYSYYNLDGAYIEVYPQEK